MRTKTSKLFIIFSSSVILVFAAIETIRACAWFEEPDNRDFSVFTPEIIRQPDKTPFFLSYHSYYGYNDGFEIPGTVPTITKRNTDEWMDFFDKKIQQADIEWLVYGSRVSQLELVRKNFAGEKVNIDTLNMPFLEKLRTGKDILATLDYLILAKKGEAYFNPDYNSWDPISYDNTSIERMLPVLKEKFSRERNKFLKVRYGFQVTRALCVSDKYTECIDFFNKVFMPGKEAGSMYYRSLGFKARAFYRLKDYSQSNYLYSLLFEQDPCSLYTAFQSFRPQEEADWNGSLSLAKTTREKEALWHLLGIYGEPVRAMKEIYSLNAKSDLLPLLLVRAVNLAEGQSLSNPLRYGDFYDVSYPGANSPWGEKEIFHMLDSSAQQPLLLFINKVIREKKAEKPAVWQLSSAYLNILNRDLRKADEALSKIGNAKDSLIMGQAEIIKGILAVKRITVMNAEKENSVYKQIQRIQSFRQPELRNDNAVRFMLSQLSLVYDKGNDSLKRELCYPEGQRFYHSSANVQQAISFMTRNNLNEFEKFLARQYPLQLADLHSEKAVALMYEYKFSEAVKEFEKKEGAGKEELLGNPFTIRITDCHDCDHQAPQKTKYTKYTFAKKMIELKARGDTSSSPEERAQNYFLYANGLYNMTWYGNGRVIHETRISANDYGTMYYGDDENDQPMTGYENCSEAMIWYQKAFTLSKNKEFKAKCTWMSAKCERNLWIEGVNRNDSLKNGDFVAGKYFNQMKKDYADTKYYQETITECGYFCTFINHSDKCIRHPESLGN